MKEVRVYRRPDALAWLPLKVRINRGGYERLTAKEPAVLKTRDQGYAFQLRLLGMRKRVLVEDRREDVTAFRVQVGPDPNTAFVLLVGLLLAAFVVVAGTTARPTNVTLVVIGLLLVPTLLTVLLGALTVVPVEEPDNDDE